jgi:hypothetical protein
MRTDVTRFFGELPRICRLKKGCHPQQSEGPAVVLVFAFAFLVVIPEGNLLFRKQIPMRKLLRIGPR